MKTRFLSILLGGFVLAAPLQAAQPGSERLSYKWKLQGGISWLAALAFPSSGRGTLETHEADTVDSRLLISADPKSYYLYESSMLPAGTKTLTSRSAYAFKSAVRDERVTFDLDKGLSRTQKTTSEGQETRVRKLESQTPQDVLTAIYYLRQHANEITTPVKAEVFSGAKGYDMVYQPLPMTTMNGLRVRPFTMKAVGDDAKKFPGEVRVWLSDDERRVPVRIDIEQKYGATLKLDLEK
ncbi:MAG TPA: DUF3108 domain-containing protein [Thermoanaerobaculia bacterium]|jgi:hypothetical protein|nr:DUF3108 domain-containing protein [Thermoanaerobaculia bacterium]